jgi:UDP-N-acetylglucosamine--N-acetylmuramyl-(pentapeptide) pyrophosphoryl-undecaprenol N-acetylglucosamine transferase
MKVIISAGGTGGHIFPAIAVADELRRRDPSVQILFVGAKGKMEMERVPKAGYAIEGLWISGFQRRLTWQNLMFPFKVISSMWKARRIINEFKPDVVVGFGGFASGPTLRVAASKGIPTVLQEQNSYAGVTNKLLAEKAVKICVAYPNMERFFPKEKVVLTGNPVRSDILNLHAKKAEGIKHFNLNPNRKTIVIIGGSLGARTLNRAMEANADLIAQSQDVQILWQCGKLYETDFKDGKAANLPNVQMKTFIDRMDLVYAAADVIIARAGALTISELCLAGVPSVLVPSPNVAEDHQTQNAMSLVNENAAILVKDIHAKEEMIEKALQILRNDLLQSDLKNNILRLGRPYACKDIADEIMHAAQPM